MGRIRESGRRHRGHRCWGQIVLSDDIVNVGRIAFMLERLFFIWKHLMQEKIVSEQSGSSDIKPELRVVCGEVCLPSNAPQPSRHR